MYDFGQNEAKEDLLKTQATDLKQKEINARKGNPQK